MKDTHTPLQATTLCKLRTRWPLQIQAYVVAHEFYLRSPWRMPEWHVNASQPEAAIAMCQRCICSRSVYALVKQNLGQRFEFEYARVGSRHRDLVVTCAALCLERASASCARYVQGMPYRASSWDKNRFETP